MLSEGRPAAPSAPAGGGVRPILVLCGLYGAQAIPLYLVAAAIPPILRARGVDLALIGSFGVLMAPWALKFLWAPVVDRFGTRRAWVLGAQAVTLAITLLLSQFDPVEDIASFFPLLMLMSVSSATQDIATDAYAVEHLAPEKHALGSAVQSGAVAAGVLLGGSLTLFVYDQAGWQIAVLGAALLSALATLPVVFAAESGSRRAGVPYRRRPSFRAFWARHEARMILWFALLFRVPEGLVKAVEQSFFVDVGFSLTKVGLISGGAAPASGWPDRRSARSGSGAPGWSPSCGRSSVSRRSVSRAIWPPRRRACRMPP